MQMQCLNNNQTVVYCSGKSRNMKKEIVLTGLIGLIVGVCVGVTATLYSDSQNESQNPIDAYYTNAAATLVSPHHLRGEMDKGHDDFILVDLRTQAEYEEEHVVGAINIDASMSKEDIVSAFQILEAENPDKDIIMYCYSAACMTGRKVGAMLASEGIYVQELTIGWNEWRYDFMSWNYPNEWDLLDPSRYVVSGSEPGSLPDVTEVPPPPCRVDGEFGC